jgi:hypothetical protein
VVVVGPAPLRVHHVLYKVAHRRGWRLSSDPGVAHDVAVRWHAVAVADDPPGSLREGWVNGRCRDTRKQVVDAAAARVFGHDVRIDPTTWSGRYVAKADANALHDGRVLTHPIPAPMPGIQYQRLIDNEVGGGMVEDLRLAVVGRSFPVAYRKLRPVHDRFSNRNTHATLIDPASVGSETELAQVLEVCDALGVDYAELDLLRDRSDGRLYVIDVNPTPYGPPNHLERGQGRQVIERVGAAFATAFGPGRL